MKKLLKTIGLIVWMSFCFCVGYTLASVADNAQHPSAVELLPEVKRANNLFLTKKPSVAPRIKKETVLFTVFKDENLGVGIDKATLEVNDEGMYLYQGKVVIATATHECVSSNVGACAMINGIPVDYHIFHYYDEAFIQVNDKTYLAIVLDSCGSCSVDCAEAYQRVDILVTDDTSNMLVEGKIIYAY